MSKYQFKAYKNHWIQIHSDTKLYKNYQKKIALANENILFKTNTELLF